MYKENPDIFAIVAMMTSLLYEWEPGSPVKLVNRAAVVHPDDVPVLERSLEFSIGGWSIRRMLNELTPLEVSHFLQGLPLEDLALSRRFSEEIVSVTVKARAAAWVLGVYGEAVRAELTHQEIESMKALDKAVKETLFNACKKTCKIH